MFKTKLGSNIFDRRCAALRLEHPAARRPDTTRCCRGTAYRKPGRPVCLSLSRPTRHALGRFHCSPFANFYTLTRRNGTLQLWNFLPLSRFSARCQTEPKNRESLNVPGVEIRSKTAAAAATARLTCYWSFPTEKSASARFF